ncbi:MAG: hypothetical protein V7647_1335 [Acidobacteriota bacterium]|jgi:type VI secretion system secreted protein VgrG
MNRRSFSFIAGVVCAGLVGAPSYVAAQTVGTAASFGIVGGTAVTAAAGATQSVVNGDVGVSPGTSITGFPAFAATTPPFATHSNDAAAISAQAATLSLYNTLVALGAGTPLGAELSNQVLGPGTYTIGAANLSSPGGPLSGTLTLNGAGLYVFKVGSSLTANVNSTVLLNGVDPCQVFWQVTSAATLNGVNFAGNVVAQAGVTLGSNATLAGRALTTSLGAVTLAGSNTISACSSSFAPAAPGPVPTLSQWAMMGLTVLLAMSGVAALRARRV